MGETMKTLVGISAREIVDKINERGIKKDEIVSIIYDSENHQFLCFYMKS